jgi:SAM-dependent methyltransferase
MANAKENYGIDAPTVVRALLVVGMVLVGVGAVTVFMLFAHLIDPGPVASMLRTVGLANGTICLVMCGWMTASSKLLKHRVGRALLDMRSWRGDETVLDIGCGRGLIAVDAARRVPNGKVTGIDLWRAQDLADNSPAGIRNNAEAAGIADRLTVDTGDARALPYPDGCFDVVASMTAIHNISGAAGRRTAIAEAWRVTKPGGQILIFDIRHARKHAAQLRAAGAVDVRMKGPILLWGPMGWRFTATKPADSR